jgi:hypothetical protein
MRRSLVLSDEAARHPFRASLPPHVRALTVEDQVQARVPWRVRLGLEAQDVRGFLMTYCACLLAVTTFIA